MHTLTVLTLDLATAIGLYWIAAGIGLLTAPDRMRAMVDDLVRVPGLTYALGLGVFAIGTAILIPHHVLYDPLSVIVTALAAIFALEGLLLIAVPWLLVRVAQPFLANARLWAVVSLVLGVLMLLAGLTGRANALT
ncbi:DUF2065 domain-containing protein [Nostoc sp. 3335mG]|nr:DUF2065 domain-containing protein [Nostoc sp. 3335mG]